jgi:hypothetical protein
MGDMYPPHDMAAASAFHASPDFVKQVEKGAAGGTSAFGFSFFLIDRLFQGR